MRKATIFLLAGLVGTGVLSQAAPEKNGFDLSNATIPVDEIHSGGPPRDGIPSIDKPRFEGVEAADRWLKAGDVVISLSLEGERRAYPLRILVWHEIVNDRFGERPVAVTYCPLCGTAMAFDARVDGSRRTFGVSGLLYNSDVLMYDRQTESLWSQLAMKAVSGPAEGTPLELLPSVHMEWGKWKETYPQGRVLSRKTGSSRNYGRTPYKSYEKTERLMFPARKYRDELKNKTWIVGLHLGDYSAAFPLGELKGAGEVEAKLGEQRLRIHHDAEEGTVRAETVPEGKRIPTTRVYWFAWQAFYPETALWRAPGER